MTKDWLTVKGDEDLMVVTDKGMIIRTHLEQILTIGRDTQGVKVIQLNEGQKVANIAIVPRSEETDEEYEDFSDYTDNGIELDVGFEFEDETDEEYYEQENVERLKALYSQLGNDQEKNFDVIKKKREEYELKELKKGK